jgi:FkbM family methyltransferase
MRALSEETMKILKDAARRSLARFGYTIRSVGRDDNVTGIDMLHDVRVLLEDKSGAILFDVGANIGQTIDSFVQAFRSPRIHAFEPSPATFEILRRGYGGRPSISLENMALGDREGTLPFHVTKDYSVNDSLLEPAWNAGGDEVLVRVETLDRYCEAYGIDHVDFLKIDAQGYDLNVLRGAGRMLGERRIEAFCVEVSFVDMYKYQPKYVDILSFVNDTGYRLVGLYEQSYIRNELQYLNACFRS